MKFKTLAELIADGLPKATIKKMARRGLLVEGMITSPDGQKIRVYSTNEDYGKFLEEEKARRDASQAKEEATQPERSEEAT